MNGEWMPPEAELERELEGNGGFSSRIVREIFAQGPVFGGI
jgi:hypothetical protein